MKNGKFGGDRRDQAVLFGRKSLSRLCAQSGGGRRKSEAAATAAARSRSTTNVDYGRVTTCLAHDLAAPFELAAALFRRHVLETFVATTAAKQIARVGAR